MKQTRLSARAGEILDRLEKIHPDADCELNYRNAYELLIATILSAQCTDKRVNAVTPNLFARYPTAKDLAGAKLPEVEEIIQSTGFFRAKAKSITGCAQALVAEHGGEVPRSFAAAHNWLRRLGLQGLKTSSRSKTLASRGPFSWVVRIIRPVHLPMTLR